MSDYVQPTPVKPSTEKELFDYLHELFEGPFDYNSSAETLWLAAYAAFEYAAHVVGASGFQGEYAALTLLGRLNGIKGPYAYIDGDKMLYPQYDILEQVREYLDSWRPWAAEQAKERLAALKPDDIVSSRVKEHWETLAAEA